MSDADRRAELRPVPGVIRIKNWKRFQNYKFRNPPWIRLYGDLLEQPWYRTLSDNGARFLVELWLLARRDKGSIPYDSLMILREMQRPTSDKPLLDAALIELASADACTVAGVDASAAFLDSLAPPQAPMQAHRVTESQSDRVSDSDTSYPGDKPPSVESNPMKILGPLIREHLYRDTKPPEGWNPRRCADICTQLLKRHSVDDLAEAIRIIPLIRARKVACDDSLQRWFAKQPHLTMRALNDQWGSGSVMDQLLHIAMKADTRPVARDVLGAA